MKKNFYSNSFFSTLLLLITTLVVQAQTTTFNYSGSIVNYTVPAGVTKLTIVAKGAQGGSSVGGRGASMQGEFLVTPGQVLKILVGQQGGGFSSNFGGGGGTFVTRVDNSPLIIAGGGGGSSCGNPGFPGLIGTAGTNGGGAGKQIEDGFGGTNGGGGGGASDLGNGGGAGGAGLLGNGGRGVDGGFLCGGTGGAGGNGTNGENGSCTSSSLTAIPLSFIAGGSTGGFGGYGGGGGIIGGSCEAAGGGGGYSGGGGATEGRGGGGGGSYNIGTNQVNASGTQTGNGLVTITAVQAPLASALSFDGADDFVSVNNPFRAFSKELTVEFWMYTPDAKMPFGSIMGQGTNNVDNWSNANVWLMHPNDDANGTMTFYVNDAGTPRAVTCNLIAGSWNHYAAVVNATSTKIYVNGALIQTGPGISNNILNNANSVIHLGKDVRYNIGIQGDRPRYGNMSLEEVRVWNRALCPEELNARKNCQLPVANSPGLQQYYQFNQGFVGANNPTVTTLNDISGNNRNGALTNFALTGTSSNWVASGVSNTGACPTYIVPTAPINGGGASICVGTTTSLTSTIGGGKWVSSNLAAATINETTGVVTAVGPGTTTITYTTECAIGSTFITVKAVPNSAITATGATNICPGTSVTLNAVAATGNTYQWFNNGNSINGANGATYNAANSGAYTVQVTNNGCSSTTSSPITINAVDATPPVFTGTATITTILNPQGNVYATSQNGAVVDYILPTATDNCNGQVNVVATPASGSVFPMGTSTVTVVATDGSGNQVTTTFTITVEGAFPSLVVPSTITVNATANACVAVVEFAATETTAVPASTITYSHQPGSTFPVGTTIVTATATNELGTDSKTFTIVVKDVTAPIVSCPPSQRLNLDASCNAVLPDYRSLVSASDNCTSPASLIITQSPAPGTVVNGRGGFFVTITVSDASNNITTCTFAVDKFDVTAPTLNVPSSITVNSPSNSCSTVVNFAKPTATDNCSGPSFNFWNPSEPNNANAAGEDYLELMANGRWNDLPNANAIRSIVEFNTVITTNFANYTRMGTFGGHTYYLSTAAASWSNSRTAAIGIGGDLVSINTIAENDFLKNYLTSTFGSLVTWAGAYQDRNDAEYAEPGTAAQNYGGWKWVDGTRLGAGQITIAQIAGLPSGSAFPVGVTTNTFTATDESGNVSTSSFTITVKDVTAPIIAAAANINATATSANGAIVNYTLPTATDNCSGIVNVTATPASGSVFPIGITTVTVTATDAAGNTATSNFTLTVTGLPPSIVVPSNITLDAPANACGAVVNFAATETTAIPASTITYSHQPGSTFPVGTTVVTATATNAVGSSTGTFEVTVKDVTAPTFAVINTVNASATDATGAVVNYTLPTATDNCSGIVNVVATPASGSLFPIGTTTVTVVATDAAGNQNTTTFNVVVKDTEAPVVKTKNATVYLDATGNASITVANINDNSTDNVGITSLSLSQTNFNCSSIGRAIQLDATSDGITSNGNLAITGNSPRTFSAWVKPTASNNIWGVVHQGNNDCSGLMFGLGLQSGNRVTFWGGCRDFVSTLVVPQNQWTYIAAVYDGAGIITLYANGSAQSINLGSLNTQISKLFVGHETTNNGGSFRNQYQGGVDDVKVYNRALTASEIAADRARTNPAGNNLVLHYPFDEGAGTTITDVAGSNNATLVSPTGSNWITGASGGNVQTILTATDAAGNTSSAPATVTVIDNLKPTINCPANISVVATAASGALVNYTIPTATDNCSIASIVRIAGPASGSIFPIGITTVSYRATDGSGNYTDCSFNVTIVGIAPVLSTPANISVNNAPGICGANVTYTATESTVGIPASTITYSIAPGSMFAIGTTTVTVTATNAVGTSIGTFTVTVVDNTNPVLSVAPEDVTVECDAVPAAAVLTATDNCSAVVTMTETRTNGINANNYILTRVWTATDPSGNTVSATQVVTVRDTKAPSLTVPSNISTNNDNGICGATVSFAASATDNCSDVTITYSKNPGTVFPVGTSEVTVTATDATGNAISQTFTVTVTDNEKPVVITRPVTVTLVNGAASVTAADVNNGSTDNCGIATMVVSPNNFSCATIGNNTVTLTVTDINGNVQTATAVVTVIGQLPTSSIVSQPTSNVYTGGNANNIYLGYGAQTTVLKVNATGGSSYTYQWMGAATNMLNSTTSGMPVFTPTAAGTYTFTVLVTNNFGCTTTSKITICVKDIRVPGAKGKGKVYLCHLPPGNNQNPQTLEISVNAVASHLSGHSGDRLGSCATAACAESAPTVIGTTATSFSKAEEVVADDLKVVVMPNPTSTYFTLKLVSKSDLPVNIKVVDAAGRLVEGKAKQAANSTLQLGHNYATGNYFAEFIQGNQRKVVQLIKIK